MHFSYCRADSLFHRISVTTLCTLVRSQFRQRKVVLAVLKLAKSLLPSHFQRMFFSPLVNFSVSSIRTPILSHNKGDLHARKQN